MNKWLDLLHNIPTAVVDGIMGHPFQRHEKVPDLCDYCHKEKSHPVHDAWQPNSSRQHEIK